MIELPFVKGEPIRFSGELANAPSYGSGCVTVREELLVPLANSEDFIGRHGVYFWPFLRGDGTVKWYYEYMENSDLPQIFFKKL